MGLLCERVSILYIYYSCSRWRQVGLRRGIGVGMQVVGSTSSQDFVQIQGAVLPNWPCVTVPDCPEATQPLPAESKFRFWT